MKRSFLSATQIAPVGTLCKGVPNPDFTPAVSIDRALAAAKFRLTDAVASERLRAHLDAGENIVVHCRGGLGRAGMISARLLVETGIDPDVAMARVRTARRGAIETSGQEHWVRIGPRSSRV